MARERQAIPDEPSKLPPHGDELEEALPGEGAAADGADAAADATDGVAAPDGAGAADAAEEEPEEPLARAERERDEYLDLARRTQAEFENYRKRAARDTAAAGARAKAGLARELLPVMDNLERALASAGEQEQHLAEGVRLVHTELGGVLERAGIEGFDPAGEPFDPARHEALSTRPEEGAEQGVVVDVVERGYTMGGSVLRPARVVVSG